MLLSQISQFLLSRVRNQLIVALLDPALVAFAGLSAFLLRFDLNLPQRYLPHACVAIAIWVLVKALLFQSFHLRRTWLPSVSLYEIARVAAANLAGSALAAPLILLLAPPGFPRSIYVLEPLLSIVCLGGLRAVMRILFEMAPAGRRVQFEPALIYGAGAAGMMLLQETRTNPALGYKVTGFIDDDPRKRFAHIHGVTVLGDAEALGRIVPKCGIRMVLVAIPSANGVEMTRILRCCHEAGVRCKTVPGFSEIISSGALVRQIRDVAVEDLLGRNPIDLDLESIRGQLEGRCVLVTGGGGSIGSELCRQIARFDPGKLVAFDVGETALFHLEQELRGQFPSLHLKVEIGSIQSQRRISELMRLHRPDAIFHAAAYKHVPMMEQHLFEAIENNVIGTYNLALAAAEARVSSFLMISSDKAVNPTNVMGATKRVAELIVNAFHQSGTSFVSVRFGNVLGSNGSVIPIFKKQIAAGGPVTVTHPDMKRYFMTIPEAVLLLLQASTMGEGGEIFVLDMGKPVRIVDLARNLILLSGLRPDADIQIEYSGLRPGEKLYEELNLADESTAPTPHEKILVFHGRVLERAVVHEYARRMRTLCDERAVGHIVLLLKEMVPEYNPSAHILQQFLAESSPAPELASMRA